ncbi:antirepressor [Mycobacterium phage Xavia]|uniref:Antirepressor n=1 Tax=Mycobacterium phage Xavia TaxID=2178923 RepID=A0A2U8UHI0_9CAUD|nr:Rha-like transcriptional regulator [Mycobacterium phage Xavia]AWN02644.1 antirepressor [Mycobacterium phage Xavia]
MNNLSNELVFVGEDGEPFTTSLVIAAETGNQHQNVVELIRDNLDDLTEVGIVRFQTGKLSEGRGRPTTYAELDELAAALLMTYLRNSPVVKTFKKRLVAGFYAMRQMLAERSAALPAGEELLALAVVEAQRIIAAKDEQIQALTAPARSWQLLADAHGDFSVAEAAKILSRDPSITTGRDRLFAFMAEQGWIFRSRNPRGGWEAYQTAVDTRRLVEKPAKPFLNSKTGAYELPAPTIRVTAKGIGKLHELMGGTEPIRFVVGEAS